MFLSKLFNSTTVYAEMHARKLVKEKSRRTIDSTAIVALPGRVELPATRLGDEKTVRLRCPSLCRKCLILLGF